MKLIEVANAIPVNRSTKAIPINRLCFLFIVTEIVVRDANVYISKLHIEKLYVKTGM